ncbi:MAG: toxin-antitoxin system TumE family protein [Chloroflexota bacterium]
MSIWRASVIRILRESGLFSSVQLAGGKVRASLTQTCFLDIHVDPTTNGYSYALIDLTLPYAGDKRLFGWDDYPHPDYAALTSLKSYPHHFQERLDDGTWQFSESAFRGDVESEIREVIEKIRQRTSGEG